MAAKTGLRLAALFAPLFATSVGLATVTAAWAARASPAALDAIPRVLAPGDPLACRDLPLVPYRGTTLRYHKPVRVHADFVPRLAAFETLVARVATRHYGRAPHRIVHLGAFNCRRMRTYPDWVSEHALGNAIDLAGFDFGPARRGQRRPDHPELRPAALRRAFSVRVERHFRALSGRRGPVARAHAAFLHDLARALIARQDIFSVVLGPGWPGHENHLHLDAAPYRVVEIDL